MHLSGEVEAGHLKLADETYESKISTFALRLLSTGWEFKIKTKTFFILQQKKHTCNRKRIRNDRKITHSIECFPIAEDLASSVCQIYSCPFAGYDQNGKTQRKYI